MPQADWERDFSDYFAARGQRLRRTAYALCGDWHVAEDLVQATFVRLYRHWRRLRTETLDSYVRRTLVNLYLTRRKAARRERIVADVPERPARESGSTEDRVDLGRALTGLSPRQRAMVVLRYLEDLPVAEVAALLGLAEGTVKSQTARGVQALRTALGQPAGHATKPSKE